MRNLMRAAWTIAGLASFVWLGWEDPSPVVVILMASLISVAWAITLIKRGTLLEQTGLMRWLLVSGLLGAAVGPLAAILMVLKTGLHGHAPPDFTIEDVLRALQLIPAWAASGALLGLAGWLGMRMTDARRPR
jgi:hypothetical protein